MANENYNAEAAGSAEADILEEQDVLNEVKREVLKTYLADCEPEAPARSNCYRELKTTRKIIQETAEMIEFSPEEVNAYMHLRGYHMQKDADGVPSWVLWMTTE